MEEEIDKIFRENKLNDLVRFMNRRQCLNTCNLYMIYFFHIIQSAGILTTSVAAGYDMKELVWIGVGLNILATLINVFEHSNSSISKKLLKNIEDIKNGTYIDEGIIEKDRKSEHQGNAGPTAQAFAGPTAQAISAQAISAPSQANTLITPYI